MLRHPIVSRTEAKEACNIRASNDEYDTLIDGLIDVATEQLETVTGRFFSQQQVTEYFGTRRTFETGFDLSGVSELGTVLRVKSATFRLKGLNIDEDTFDLRYDYMREWGDDTITSPSDYILDTENGTLKVLHGTRESERSIRAVYTAGYEPSEVTLEGADDPVLTLSENIPAAIREACLLQVIYLRARRRPDNVGLTGDRSTGKGDSFVQTMAWAAKQGVTPEALGLVRHLKRPVMGRY